MNPTRVYMHFLRLILKFSSKKCSGLEHQNALLIYNQYLPFSKLNSFSTLLERGVHTILSNLSTVYSSLKKYILQNDTKLGKLRLGDVHPCRAAVDF